LRVTQKHDIDVTREREREMEDVRLIKTTYIANVSGEYIFQNVVKSVVKVVI